MNVKGPCERANIWDIYQQQNIFWSFFWSKIQLKVNNSKGLQRRPERFKKINFPSSTKTIWYPKSFYQLKIAEKHLKLQMTRITFPPKKAFDSFFWEEGKMIPTFMFFDKLWYTLNWFHLRKISLISNCGKVVLNLWGNFVEIDLSHDDLEDLCCKARDEVLNYICIDMCK